MRRQMPEALTQHRSVRPRPCGCELTAKVNARELAPDQHAYHGFDRCPDNRIGDHRRLDVADPHARSNGRGKASIPSPVGAASSADTNSTACAHLDHRRSGTA
jgi:hypothetical protein